MYTSDMNGQIYLVIFVIVALGVALFVSTPSVQAQFPPFGGPIVAMFPCATPPGILFYLGPPFPIPVMFVPGSIPRLFGAFHPGAWTLGTVIPVPIPCCFPTCPPLGALFGFGAPIIQIGTSF